MYCALSIPEHNSLVLLQHLTLWYYIHGRETVSSRATHIIKYSYAVRHHFFYFFDPPTVVAYFSFMDFYDTEKWKIDIYCVQFYHKLLILQS